MNFRWTIDELLMYYWWTIDELLMNYWWTIDEHLDKLNYELNKIANWLKLNKLYLDIKKTNYILFRAGNKLIKNSGLCIMYQDRPC